MYKLCVFAGTTEGRQLVEFLSAQPVSVTACVATDYGQTLLTPQPNLTILSGRLLPDKMEELFLREKFDLVVDATHPYATGITGSIQKVSAATDTPCLRLLRPSGIAPENAVFVENAAAAAAFLNGIEGNILLTTGAKELSAFSGIRDFANRVYARVLPMPESLALCQAAGVQPSHILAMQGPFSRGLNEALLQSTGACYLVTKDGGGAGGFPEKVEAAQNCGVQMVILGRPADVSGLSLSQTVEELCRRFSLTPKPRISLVGIGLGNRDTLTGQVSDVLSQADCLIGAKRMLEAVARPGQVLFDAVSPGEIALYCTTHSYHRHIAVVLSGDAGFFSGAKKLIPLLPGCEVLPGLSSMVYFCSRLQMSYEEVLPVSLHGRTHSIVRQVRTHSRVFCLLGGSDGISKLCASLLEAGLNQVTVHIGSRLSYPEETICHGLPEDFTGRDFDPLSVALIENPHANSVHTPGLPDEAFLRNATEKPVVPMTKQEIRALVASQLRLTDGCVCWDVGAGTGSVSIEMALLSPRGQVYAIEQKPQAVELIEENKRRFSVDNLTVVPGCAPEACEGLPAPTHVFIGGSSGNLPEILALVLKKNPHARIVATAVSLEAISELTACAKRFPFASVDAVSLTAARSRKAGAYHLMTGQNPVTIFTLQA